ncbi:MAG TPA: penicillin-binding protein 2 [Bryobacteraceae bacterium]|nr:penicillin-binding protein 2 [Bryobacteraceae bacterium]
MILPPVDPNLEQQITEKAPLRDDTHFAAGKIAVFQYVTVGIFLFLISGFWALQVQNPQFYGERAEANRIKSVPILAPRGRILDRDGRVIVDNHASFSLILRRDSLKEEHLRPIAQGLDLEYNDLAAQVRKVKLAPKYVPIVVKQELTEADLAFVDSHRDFFPELELIPSQRRLYPQNGMMAHLIGYTGQISEEELDAPEFAKYNQGDIVGKFGIERQYNDWLTGVNGQSQVVVDNRGQVRGRPLKEKEAVAGKDLQLTIDLDLQAVAELALEGKKGAVVALDPRTGEVLAMASRPTFDLNKFSTRMKAKEYKAIADNPDGPLINRAIQAQFAPGSTFKPFTAIAGLESGAIDDQFSVHCAGGVSFYGHYYHCLEKHGTLSLHRAIVESCDSYFYTVGNKAGIDNISFYGNLAGFGQLTGIDLPHEKAGIMPSSEWKLRTFRTKWYAGETIPVAIGQGYLTVTPIQLAHAIGGLALGGKWHKPHLLKGEKPDKPVEWALNPANVKDIIDGMYGVVNEGGTGGRARLPYVEVCGKTGSAQLASNEYVKAAGAAKSEELKDNAWFEGFAPRAAPEIVVVALFEHGYRGQFAAPIVRDVLAAYFDKKKRLAAYQQMESANAARLAAMSNLGLPQSQGLGAEKQGSGAEKQELGVRDLGLGTEKQAQGAGSQTPEDGAILETPAPADKPVPATKPPVAKPQPLTPNPQPPTANPQPPVSVPKPQPPPSSPPK